MPRPKIKRILHYKPNAYYYKPRGIPLSELEEVILCADEVEALKLYEIDDLDQISAAKRMKISQPTFARILDKATRKISTAILTGKAIRIEKKEEVEQ